MFAPYREYRCCMGYMNIRIYGFRAEGVANSRESNGTAGNQKGVGFNAWVSTKHVFVANTVSSL